MFVKGINFQDFYRDSQTSMHLIEEGLFLGSLEAVQNRDLLKLNNITRIISILDTFRYFQPFDQTFEHMRIEIPDSTEANIVSHLPACLKFISDSQKTENSVLVHCAAGVSRSASIVIGYIMVKYSYDFDTAKRVVKDKRNCIWPNGGFSSQLRNINVDSYKQYLE